jgi:hypothetical protein
MLLIMAWLGFAGWIARLVGQHVIVGILLGFPFTVLAFPIVAYVSDVYLGGDKRITKYDQRAR